MLKTNLYRLEDREIPVVAKVELIFLLFQNLDLHFDFK